MAPQTQEQKIVMLPLSQIEAILTWNCRSGDWQNAQGSEQDSGFADLKNSIKARGQDDAVLVMPNGKKSGKQYELVAGFRRFVAIDQIAKEDKVQNPVIKAIVLPEGLDLATQRSINIRENTARDDLKAADLAFAIHDLVMLQKQGGGAPTSVSIAAEIGKNQAWVARLMKIMEKVDPKITEQWRTSKLDISVDKMSALSELPTKQEQNEAFKEMLKAKEDGGSKKGPDAWVGTVEKKAGDFAFNVGRLEGLELINGTEAIDWEECLDELFPILSKKKSKRAVYKKLAKVMAAKVKEGIEYQPEVDEEEEEEE